MYLMRLPRRSQEGGTTVETELAQCTNKRCPRHNVLVVQSRFCSTCGRKMKPYSSQGHLIGMGETPPASYGQRWLEDAAIRAHHFDASYSRGGNHNQTLPVVTLPQADNDDEWSSECLRVRGCPIASTDVKVEVPLRIYNQWVFLANQFSTEWIAYLIGQQADSETHNWQITDFYFPKQVATGAHLDVDKEWLRDNAKPNTIGSVHSHVGMRAFFSSEDEKHFNHAVEMVINRSGDMCANIAIRLECGRSSRMGTKVIWTECETELALAQQLREAIVEESAHRQSTWDKNDIITFDHRGFEQGYGV